MEAFGITAQTVTPAIFAWTFCIGVAAAMTLFVWKGAAPTARAPVRRSERPRMFWAAFGAYGAAAALAFVVGLMVMVMGAPGRLGHPLVWLLGGGALVALCEWDGPAGWLELGYFDLQKTEGLDERFGFARPPRILFGVGAVLALAFGAVLPQGVGFVLATGPFSLYVAASLVDIFALRNL